jgi:hypothetical protein
MFAHTYEPVRRGIPSISNAVLSSSKFGPNTKVWFQRSPSDAKIEVEIIGKFLDWEV